MMGRISGAILVKSSPDSEWVSYDASNLGWVTPNTSHISRLPLLGDASIQLTAQVATISGEGWEVMIVVGLRSQNGQPELGVLADHCAVATNQLQMEI